MKKHFTYLICLIAQSLYAHNMPEAIKTPSVKQPFDWDLMFQQNFWLLMWVGFLLVVYVYGRMRQKGLMFKYV